MKTGSKISKDVKKQILADKDELSVHQISKKYNLPRLEVEKILKSATKETPKWFYLVMVAIPIIGLIVLEVVLRMTNYGYNFDQWVDVGEGKYTINVNIGKKYFTSGGFNPTTNEDYFDIHKKPNSFRVFVLGGSSTEGFPYSPMGAFSRYIRQRLELVYPGINIEVVNLGMTGVNSYTLLDILPGVLEQKPDLILIYAGHNEYYGALGVGSTQSFGSSRAVTKLILYLNDFKTTQLVRNSVQWLMSQFSSSEVDDTKGTLMSRMPKDKNILLNSEEYKEGLEQFRGNLEDMLEMIKEKNVPVLLGRLVSNLKDQKPFVSEPTPGYGSADLVYEKAMNAFNENASTVDSLFVLAKDLDALRFRAPEELNSIMEYLGKNYNVPIVPVDSLFRTESPKGIVGDNLIVDHLHPNVKGYQLIGKAFYNSMEKYNYLPKTEEANIPFAMQDSITCKNFIFTKLDSAIGNYNIALLKTNWPYVKEKKALGEFQQRDFMNLLKPSSFVDTIAIRKLQGLSWLEAHLLAARTYLRRDDIENYYEHIKTLLYQYPVLGDFNSLITYFYNRKQLDLSDYTAKRVGIISIYRQKYDDAINYLTRANQASPNDPTILYNLAYAYSKKGNYQAAINNINECLSVDPGYPKASELKKKIQVQL